MSLAVVVIGTALCTTTPLPPHADQDLDLQVFVMQKEPDPGKGSWSMTLDASGKLTVETLRETSRAEVPVSKRRELLEIITRERFFDLKDEYGTAAIAADFRAIQVKAGGRTKRVVLASDLAAERDREGLKRAVRVWLAIRDLFAVPGVVDTRDRDQQILQP
jgi:hypothetical protein